MNLMGKHKAAPGLHKQDLGLLKSSSDWNSGDTCENADNMLVVIKIVLLLAFF